MSSEISQWVSNTPVVLIIYRRAEMLRQVLRAVAQVNPSLLLVIGDGPRLDSPDDPRRVQETRQVLQEFNWSGEVRTNYAETNLGLRKRVISGLNWVFEQVEEAIILEEDCVPHPAFFRFCDELLERYRDDRRIMAIGGANYQFGRNATPYSYYFSIFNHVWGWASWRRAWKLFDAEMIHWPDIRDSGKLYNQLHSTRAVKYWTKRFQDTHDGKINSWAYTWTYSCWSQNGLAILPAVNMVSNIGSGLEASHTHGRRDPRMHMLASGLDFPLKHPPLVMPHFRADQYTQRRFFKVHPLAPLKRKLKEWLS
ncbi:MAG: hypothetical protein JXB15_02095 [Anaerolineales bacterium]|nr:hypothetical protein [Anaerolineales bacterium]